MNELIASPQTITPDPLSHSACIHVRLCTIDALWEQEQGRQAQCELAERIDGEVPSQAWRIVVARGMRASAACRTRQSQTRPRRNLRT